MWPWEALLWSSTVYYDETTDQSMAAYEDWHDVPALQGPSLEMVRGWRQHEQTSPTPSTTPEGSPARQLRTVAPTPFLLHGLRPLHLPPPPTHRSGLLGESPMSVQFKHFGRRFGSGGDEDEAHEEHEEDEKE